MSDADMYRDIESQNGCNDESSGLGNQDGELTTKDVMDVMGRVREENYMRGYKEGFQQGRIIGFEDGIKKGIREMERGNR